jgi:hypothetical protein
MKIDFEFDTVHGVFRDALHLPDDHGLTNEQLESMKAERRDNWIAFVDNMIANPPQEQPVELPVEELQTEQE